MAAQIVEAQSVLKNVRSQLMRKSNVVATGIGYKVTAGKTTKELALIVSVDAKKSVQSLTETEKVPPSFDGIPTDVYPTGVIHALQDPTGRFRPAPGGVSIGHFNITAGTLGCLVKKGGKLYILSNNHVLANSNDGSPGDAILQPGPYDGGSTASDKIAELSDFIPIEFLGDTSPCPIGGTAASFLNIFAALSGSKTRVQSVRAQAGENLVDCAIAEPLNQSDVKNEILNIGQISGVVEGTLGMSLKKSGRTTGLTTGSVTQIDVTSQVSYGTNKTAIFTDQLMAGAMSAGGDSGSAVLNDQNKIVGLLFAGSSSTTIINRIQNVFQALGVTLP